MNEVIIYLLKVIAIHGILYLVYHALLRNSNRHGLNRTFLLSAVLLAFAIPFIEFSVPASATEFSEENPVIVWLSEPTASFHEFELVPVKNSPYFSYWSLIPWLYALIAGVLVIRSLVYLFLLRRLKRQSEHIRKRWFSLFKTSHKRPFSFFSNVFIPTDLFGSDAFGQILAHECVHVRQFHSMDRLLLDFVGSLFWFNPFIYLYRNALIEIHEYQADEAVVKRFKDPIGYQEILFSQLQSAQYSGLVSHFNFSMIKKRIVMMNKNRKMSGWVYVLTLPIMLTVVFAFSSKQAMEPLSEVGDGIALLLGPEKEFQWAALDFTLMDKEEAQRTFQQENLPSIMPIKEASLARLTSGFGKRVHPIKKTEQWHLGIDFSCKVGSEVVATANGTIESVTDNPEGYGKLILVDHGNEYKTRYAQLSEFKVEEGDQVKKGQVIALSGNSGLSTAPHLHYEVQKGDKRVDPVDYIEDYDFRPRIKEIKTPQTGKSQKEEALQRREEALAAKELELVRKEEALAKKALEQADKMNQQEQEKAQEELRRAEMERERMEMEKKQELRFKQKDGDETTFTISTDKRSRNGKTPLFVLDGLEVTDISGLSPEEIESVVVLKGEKAIDKYGEKATDGVIEISTKIKEKDKQKSKAKEKSKKQAYRVIIDPGHGGEDSGAVSPNGLKESDVALAVAMSIKSHLSDQDIEVVCTRKKDEFVSLKERSQLSQEADLFISLHTDNYSEEEKSFILPIYYEGNAYSRNSLYFATLLSEEFQNSGGSTQVGSIYECAPQATTKYDLLGKANCPAVLLNVGFFSNAQVEKDLKTAQGQDRVALHIANAIKSAIL